MKIDRLSTQRRLLLEYRKIIQAWTTVQLFRNIGSTEGLTAEQDAVYEAAQDILSIAVNIEDDDLAEMTLYIDDLIEALTEYLDDTVVRYVIEHSDYAHCLVLIKYNADATVVQLEEVLAKVTDAAERTVLSDTVHAVLNSRKSCDLVALVGEKYASYVVAY